MESNSFRQSKRMDEQVSYKAIAEATREAPSEMVGLSHLW
jgi:hypothetical protein